MNRKRIVRLVLYTIGLLLTIIFILLGKTYHFNKVIESDKTYKKYKKYDYISINLMNKELHRLSSEEINSDDYDCYIVNFNNNDVLILLKKNTTIDKNIRVKKSNDSKLVTEIKKKFKDKKFVQGYYTNVDLIIKDNSSKIKNYILYSIMGAMLYLIIKEILLIIMKK